MILNNKVAVVTGGNRGLGFELCKQLGANGYTVLLTARDFNSATRAAEKFSDEFKIRPYELDIANPQSTEDFAAALREDGIDRVDLLINCAGVNIDHPELIAGTGKPPSLFSSSLTTFTKTFETNVLGAYSVTKTLLPFLQKSPRALILNISSGMGQLSTMGAGYPAYRISKTALNALTKILAAELADDNIAVNSVCPGWVRTDMGGPNADLSPEQSAANILWLVEKTNGQTGMFFQNKTEIDW